MIYADWAATAPLCPAARDVLRQWLEEPLPANPSSVHSFGMDASDRLSSSRQVLARAAFPEGEVTFVSGGTEGLSLAVYSLVQHSLASGRRRVVLSPLEHPAVREAAAAFALPCGMTVEECAVTPDGTVDMADFAARMGPDLAFAAVMAVQNETGVIQPVEACASLAHGCGAYLLTDAVQAAGHVFLPAEADMAVISGHKFGAPAGTGAVLHRIPLFPLQKGGGQESGYRGGTENLPGICAMAAAVSCWPEMIRDSEERLRPLRDRLEEAFLRRMASCGIPVTAVGGRAARIGTVSLLVFPDPAGPLGENLVLSADLAGLAVSAGSACHSGSPEPSRALLAMGFPPSEAQRAVRLSFGPGTTAAEMEASYRILGDTVVRLSLGIPDKQGNIQNIV